MYFTETRSYTAEERASSVKPIFDEIEKKRKKREKERRRKERMAVIIARQQRAAERKRMRQDKKNIKAREKQRKKELQPSNARVRYESTISGGSEITAGTFVDHVTELEEQLVEIEHLVDESLNKHKFVIQQAHKGVSSLEFLSNGFEPNIDDESPPQRPKWACMKVVNGQKAMDKVEDLAEDILGVAKQIKDLIEYIEDDMSSYTLYPDEVVSESMETLFFEAASVNVEIEQLVTLIDKPFRKITKSLPLVERLYRKSTQYDVNCAKISLDGCHEDIDLHLEMILKSCGLVPLISKQKDLLVSMC